MLMVETQNGRIPLLSIKTIQFNIEQQAKSLILDNEGLRECELTPLHEVYRFSWATVITKDGIKTDVYDERFVNPHDGIGGRHLWWAYINTMSLSPLVLNKYIDENVYDISCFIEYFEDDKSLLSNGCS